MAKNVDRPADSLDDRGDVLGLARDRIVSRISAATDPSPGNPIDGETRLEPRRNRAPTLRRRAAAMHKQQRWPLAADVICDWCAIFRCDLCHIVLPRVTDSPRSVPERALAHA